MPKIVILPHQELCPDGAVLEANSGETILDAALRNGIEIEHACEKSCACTTCHCIVREGFDSLPESIKEELQIMCVLYTEDVGGVLMLVFDEEGNLELKVDHEENDFAFDEIGSVLKVKQLQQTKRELFESLELFFRVFYLGEDIPEETKPQNP